MPLAFSACATLSRAARRSPSGAAGPLLSPTVRPARKVTGLGAAPEHLLEAMRQRGHHDQKALQFVSAFGHTHTVSVPGAA